VGQVLQVTTQTLGDFASRIVFEGVARQARGLFIVLAISVCVGTQGPQPHGCQSGILLKVASVRAFKDHVKCLPRHLGPDLFQIFAQRHDLTAGFFN
jgi:hypothetical protein